MTEARKIPELATTAMRLLNAQYQADMASIGVQTVAALGLSESDNWVVDFKAGVLTREVPDPPSEAPPHG